MHAPARGRLPPDGQAAPVPGSRHDMAGGDRRLARRCHVARWLTRRSPFAPATSHAAGPGATAPASCRTAPPHPLPDRLLPFVPALPVLRLPLLAQRPGHVPARAKAGAGRTRRHPQLALRPPARGRVGGRRHSATRTGSTRQRDASAQRACRLAASAATSRRNRRGPAAWRRRSRAMTRPSPRTRRPGRAADASASRARVRVRPRPVAGNLGQPGGPGRHPAASAPDPVPAGRRLAAAGQGGHGAAGPGEAQLLQLSGIEQAVVIILPAQAQRPRVGSGAAMQRHQLAAIQGQCRPAADRYGSRRHRPAARRAPQASAAVRC